jgi:hypothetical protein
MFFLTNKNNHKLVIILALAVILRVIFFPGFFPSDQFSYSSSAINLAEGKWNIADDLFSTRWGLTIPTALFYWLFGVNEFSSTLWPMLCSLGTVMVAYLLGRRLADEQTGLLAAIILAVFPLEIFYAGQLMADGPLGFWLLLSLYCFLRGDSMGSKKSKRYSYLISGMALGIAYATKQEAILVLPFFPLFALIRRRIDWQSGWLALGFCVIFGIEFIAFYTVTGDGLYRLTLKLQKREMLSHDLGLQVLNSLKINTEIGRYFYWMLIDIHNVGISFVILIGILVFHIIRGLRVSRSVIRSYWPVLLWAGTILTVLTFFPLSMKPYISLHKQVNYMLMFTTPLLIVLALLLNQLSGWARRMNMALIILSCFPTTYFMVESYRAHVDNSRAIYAFYKERRDRPLYATMYNMISLEYFDHFRNKENYKDFTLSRPWSHKPVKPKSLEIPPGSYIAVDQYFINFYTDRGHKFPPSILKPPSHWQPVFKYQREPSFLRPLSLKGLEGLRQKGLITEDLHAKISKKVMSWSHSIPVIIYIAGDLRSDLQQTH